ncbi:MAG TPA: VOC family protein [Acidimicrobiales bacterium]|nr:VOC family protein [Acidimicrobiales bacterium]
MDGLGGLSHFGFPSADLDRTIAFYTEVLGAKVQWQTERQTKIYVGDIGLAIPLGAPQPQYDLHFAFKADADKVDEVFAHIEGCGVEVDGPHGHAAEPLNISWFFRDPDGYRLEIEAHFASVEAVIALLERDYDKRKPEMGLYKGPDALPELREQLAPVAG